MLHQTPFEGTLARKIHQHKANQDHQKPLPGQHQHGHTGQDEHDAEEVLPYEA
jgi:hypothetical protein